MPNLALQNLALYIKSLHFSKRRGQFFNSSHNSAGLPTVVMFVLGQWPCFVAFFGARVSEKMWPCLVLKHGHIFGGRVSWPCLGGRVSVKYEAVFGAW